MLVEALEFHARLNPELRGEVRQRGFQPGHFGVDLSLDLVDLRLSNYLQLLALFYRSPRASSSNG